MRKNTIIIIGAIIILVLLASFLVVWAPWVTKDYLDKNVRDYIGASCNLNCEGCGVISYDRKFLKTEVEFNMICGVKSNEPVGWLLIVSNFGETQFKPLVDF